MKKPIQIAKEIDGRSSNPKWQGKEQEEDKWLLLMEDTGLNYEDIECDCCKTFCKN